MTREPTTTVQHTDLRFVGDCLGRIDAATEPAHGVDWRGERLLDRYAWRWLGPDGIESRTLLIDATEEGALRVQQTWLQGGVPSLTLTRTLRVGRTGAVDEVEAENVGAERVALSIELTAAGADASAEVGPRGLILRGSATPAVRLAFDTLAAARPDGADWELSLAAGERVQVSVAMTVGVGTG